MEAGRCTSCGGEVLAVKGLGQTFVVEPLELLPEGRCGFCRGKGTVAGDLLTRPLQGSAQQGVRYKQGPVPCRRCGGTGVRGTALARGMVLVDELGRARALFGDRDRGEAVHQPHTCAEQEVAA